MASARVSHDCVSAVFVLTEVHPRHGEVDAPLALQGDGEVGDGHVGFLWARQYRRSGHGVAEVAQDTGRSTLIGHR